MAADQELQLYLQAMRNTIQKQSLNTKESTNVSHYYQSNKFQKTPISTPSISISKDSLNSSDVSTDHNNLKNVKLLNDSLTYTDSNIPPSKPLPQDHDKGDTATEVSLESWMKSTGSSLSSEEDISNVLNIHTIDELENDEQLIEEIVSDHTSENGSDYEDRGLVSTKDHMTTLSDNISYSSDEFEEDETDHENDEEYSENEMTGQGQQRQQTDHLYTTTTDIGIQTSSSLPNIIPEYQINREYLRPTPLLPHVVTSEALEALTSYSPSMLALQDIMRSQLALTRNLVEHSQNLSESVLNSTKPNYQYTTLNETRQFIQQNRPKVLSYEDALKLVKSKKI